MVAQSNDKRKPSAPSLDPDQISRTTKTTPFLLVSTFNADRCSEVGLGYCNSFNTDPLRIWNPVSQGNLGSPTWDCCHRVLVSGLRMSRRQPWRKNFASCPARATSSWRTKTGEKAGLWIRINFGSGSYLEGHFGARSCPRIFSDPDPCLWNFCEIFAFKVGMYI